MRPEELAEMGLQVPAPKWPKGTRRATKEAFEAGKRAAVKAMLDRIENGNVNMFWDVRPLPFRPPKWTEE